jgi:hypothetical protein
MISISFSTYAFTSKVSYQIRLMGLDLYRLDLSPNKFLVRPPTAYQYAVRHNVVVSGCAMSLPENPTIQTNLVLNSLKIPSIPRRYALNSRVGRITGKVVGFYSSSFAFQKKPFVRRLFSSVPWGRSWSLWPRVPGLAWLHFIQRFANEPSRSPIGKATTSGHTECLADCICLSATILLIEYDSLDDIGQLFRRYDLTTDCLVTLHLSLLFGVRVPVRECALTYRLGNRWRHYFKCFCKHLRVGTGTWNGRN